MWIRKGLSGDSPTTLSNLNMESKDRAILTAVIKRYKKKFPQEWELWLKHRDEARHSLKDDYGTNDTGSMRFAGTLPERLDLMLRATIPNYLEGSNAKWFLEAFPVFRVAEKT